MTVSMMEMSLSHAGQLILGTDLRSQGWAFGRGTDVARWFNLDDESWQEFAEYWEGLSLDEHMADRGTYRYRRYSEFEFQKGGDLKILPHKPYEQPKNINTLNGGVARQFLPLEQGFIEHPFFSALLAGMAGIFDDAQGQRCRWNIRLHPYRIVTNDYEQGKPTPEGRHRDGVDYIIMMLVRRVGITGGITRVSSPDNTTLFEGMLARCLDMIVADDRQVLHEVSPIDCAHPGEDGYRDALIIAFTRMESPA